MKKGRYNILINGVIKKYNVYMNDYHNMFIYYEKKYQMIKRLRPYKGGWLWKLRNEEY